ncbi:hypothetical protein HDU84_000498 [Entophlyctis sp. JEL0112]|nr:hypothetical protein HDU84_000498 [Entophlyctis sp. JEL0112]
MLKSSRLEGEATGGLFQDRIIATVLANREAVHINVNYDGKFGRSSGRLADSRLGFRFCPTNRRSGSTREVIFAVGFYVFTAIVMIMANKAVLNTVPLPLTFLWLQILVAVFLLMSASALGFYNPPPLDPHVCYPMLPLILVNVTGLTLNTLCLQYVDASFYQIARALVLPFTVLFSRIMLRAKISTAVNICCAIVFAGFLAGTTFETSSTTVSRTGLFLGIASSVTTAVHAVIIKTSFGIVGGRTSDLVYFNNCISLLVLFPVVWMSGELSDLAKLLGAGFWNSDGLAEREKIQALVIGGFTTGVFGFLINIAGFFQIKVTSPLTHMISSAFRGVLQTIIAVVVFNDVVTPTRMMSVGMVLMGSCLYAWIKSREEFAGGGGSVGGAGGSGPETKA